ncbi:MAG: 4-(cytidine 5'-diphospho)-2-C-methyl-D-erythritol kinase [Marinilabiliaceae bacterium]|nr:4-(cytidine 5'-diphospho)-2-C-methyl-D-erythritol kinase [Marinilabiliaceae bacterium]
MILFPNAKINLGLNVISKKDDGYHNIETVFLPVNNFCDVLEVVPKVDGSKEDSISFSGLAIPGDKDDNLCLKAVQLLREVADIQPLNIFLHKVIPCGSGLGGGSSDAAFMLKLLNELFNIALTHQELQEIASEIGADCAFFILNSVTFAEGIGNLFSPLEILPPRIWIEIVVPSFHVSTSFAYKNIVPCHPKFNLKSAICLPIENWRDKVINDFEPQIFDNYPELKDIKEKLYSSGAIYASMSGSGSAVFGLFKWEPAIEWDAELFVYSGYL